jgi:hypothetical protein
MGRVGVAQDSYPRRRTGPKLTVTGRLHGTADGRPVEIEAEGRELLIRVARLRAAWELRRSVSAGTAPVLRVLRDHGLHLRLRVGAHMALQVLPRPHPLLRLLLPVLRRSTAGASRGARRATGERG